MSPIKGISEIVRLPRLGKIRLGIKKGSEDGVSYPSPTDHFVCPDEVKKVFGEKPKKLRIMFPTEDREQWASQYFRRYSSLRRLICRGDGEMAMVRADNVVGQALNREPSSLDLKEIVCNPRSCPHYRCGDCRRVMNLQFLLPDCPGFGVYQLDTSSYHSMLSVNSILDFTRSICGRVSMIPLLLQLTEMEVEPEGWLTRVYVLSMTCPHSLADIQRYARIPPGQALLLPPPDGEAPDDLFSEGLTGAKETSKPAVGPDETLIDLWTKAKSKIWHFEIRDSQIANWFEKNYRLTVSLVDFDPPAPPAKFTAEILHAFCQSIDRFTRR